MPELRAADASKEWKAGKFRPVYLFVGEEVSAKREALAELKAAFKPDDFNFREFSGASEDDAAAAVAEASTLPVFAERRLVMVTGGKLLTGPREVFAAYLKDPLPSTTLVLVCEDKKADSKDAMTRAAAAAGAVCVYAPLGEDEAEQRLTAAAKKAGKTLSEEAAQLLVAEAGTDWAILSQELEKLLLYAKGETISAEDALDCLGYRKAADPFALTRLIYARSLPEAALHLRRLFADGKPDEQAFKALAQISGAVTRQLRAKKMLAAKVPSDAIYRALRLHPYWDKDFLARLGKFTERRLVVDAKRCVRVDADLKSKTWLDKRQELERLVVELCAA